MKNSLLLIIILTFSNVIQAQVNVFECTAENSSILPLEFSSNLSLIQKPCVIFENPSPYSYQSPNQKTIKGVNNIEIKTDFYAKPVGNGFVHLKTGNKADFEVVCMNYTDLTAVKKLKKFELGVTLPNGVQEKVDNFINEVNVPDNERLNPYMDWDLRVIAEFTHPDIPWTISIDGFYNQEFEAWMEDPLPAPVVPVGQYLSSNQENNWQGYYNSLGGYNQMPSDYPFLFRFAPPLNGKWTCKVKIVLANETYESDFFNFSVIESGSLGYLKVGDEERYFKLGDSGFYPVGANVLWPFTTSEIKNNNTYKDEYLIELLPEVLIGEPDIFRTLSEEYMQMKPIPRIYNNHRNLIKNMADGGANMIKLSMNSFSQEIEWEKLGNYTKRLYQAQELDNTLELCEERGVLIDWGLQYQGVLNPKTCYSDVFATSWGTENGYYGSEYCYKKLIKENNPENANNFEFTNNPIHFFSDEVAKGFYKQRIRYFLARYGYSTNIGIFELFSEINTNMYFDQTANSNCEFPEISEANYEIIETWHAEMAAYIKSHHNGAIHLVAPVYINDAKKNDATRKNPQIDLYGQNIYPGLKTYGQNWINEIQKDLLNQDASNPDAKNIFIDCEPTYPNAPSLGNTCTSTRKPFYLTEFDPTEELCDNNQIEVRRAIWQIPFSGAAAAFSWHAYKNGIVFSEYAKIKQFMSQIDLDNGGWHPGAMARSNEGYWLYKSNWADDMDKYTKGDNSKDQTYKADLMYLRSQDQKNAIGVITNKTYNIYNSNTDVSCDGLRQNWDDKADPDKTPIEDLINPPLNGGTVNINSNNENNNNYEAELKLRGMKAKRYIIDYYNPHNPDVIIATSEDNGPTVKIEFNIAANAYDYIILFKAHLKNDKSIDEDVIDEAEDQELVDRGNVELENTIEVYPNPSSDLIQIKSANESLLLMYDDTGKLLLTKTIAQELENLNMENFENGVYIFKFIQKDNLVVIKKIVKL